LSRVDQILFLADESQKSYQVELILMQNERQDALGALEKEDATRLAGWLGDVIHQAGKAEVTWSVQESARSAYSTT
jgi:hypothetical protein